MIASVSRSPLPNSARPGREPKVSTTIRDVFEATGGVIVAGTQIAASLIPCTIVGGMEGWRKAKDPDSEVDAARVARNVTIGTALQALAPSTAIGFAANGLKGAAVALAGQGIGAATGILLLTKGGSAGLIGEGMAADLNERLEGENRLGSGVLKGMATGFRGGVIYNAQAGYREGKGAFSGLVEGVVALPKAFAAESQTKLSGNWLQKAAQVTAATLGAVLAAPAGLVHGLVDSFLGSQDFGLARQTVYTAGALAVAAAGWPLTLGMLGPALVAASVAGAVGVVSSLVAGNASLARVPSAVAEAQKDNKPMDDPISDKRQKMFEGAVVGGAAAAGVGWDRGVRLLST